MSEVRAEIGIVIVTFNSADVIATVLESLDSGMASVRHRTVVVDNHSTDDTVTIVRNAGVEVVQLDHNGGYSVAINRGSEHLLDARSILVLNPDVKLTPGVGEAMLRQLDDDDVGVVASMIRHPSGAMEFNLRRDPTARRMWGTALLGGRHSQRFAPLSEVVADRCTYGQPGDVDWAMGAALLIDRRCLDAVGPWDESFFLYSEETEFCQRARARGFRIRYTPSACIYHQGGGGSNNPRLRTMMMVNKVRLYRRHHKTASSWGFYAGMLFNELTRAATGSTASRVTASALMRPRLRPPEIGASNSVMPR